MKKKIMFGLLCLLSFTTVVRAEELTEPLASIVKDGTLHVDARLPKTEFEFSNIQKVLNEQYKEYLKDDSASYDKSLGIGECSKDYSTCTLYYTGCITNEGCGTSPVQVKVNWQEDTVENYSAEFKKIAPNGSISFNSVAPKNAFELDSYTYEIYEKHPNVFIEFDSCNDTYTKCDVVYRGSDIQETHNVQFKWVTADQTVQKQVDENLKKLKEKLVSGDGYENTYVFTVSDLNLINYLSHLKSQDQDVDASEILSYSQEFKNMFGDTNFDYILQGRMGDVQPFYGFVGGSFAVSYNGTIYGTVSGIIGVDQKYVLYIPDETENTQEAYIKAAKKRIDEHLGNNHTTIEVAGKTSDYKDFDYSMLGDTSKMSEYYYNVKVGNVTKEFVIIKDSSKIEKVELSTTDSKTSISISTENTELPLDTKVIVEEIEKTSKTFTKLNEVLKLGKKEEVQVYDLKLFSKTTDSFITKLSTGEFLVTIPIKQSLLGKKLSAYYVTSDNKIEEYPITIVNNMGRFKTTHFSIYTIAETGKIGSAIAEDELTEEVPKTFDGIMNYILIGIIGLIGLGTTCTVYKKREN